jgi:hypothetical protein
MLTTSKAQALELGMTHEATIAGVPHWVVPVGDDIGKAVCKVPLLRHWVDFVSWLYDAATHFIPHCWRLEFPIKVGQRIK